jgi:hypothetical protein
MLSRGRAGQGGAGARGHERAAGRMWPIEQHRSLSLLQVPRQQHLWQQQRCQATSIHPAAPPPTRLFQGGDVAPFHPALLSRVLHCLAGTNLQAEGRRAQHGTHDMPKEHAWMRQGATGAACCQDRQGPSKQRRESSL